MPRVADLDVVGRLADVDLQVGRIADRVDVARAVQGVLVAVEVASVASSSGTRAASPAFR